MRQVSFPVTATSANFSGTPELETIAQIQEALGTHVSMYFDGGRLVRPVSTVVKCLGNDMRILREGAIASDEIYSILSQQGLR